MGVIGRDDSSIRIFTNAELQYNDFDFILLNSEKDFLVSLDNSNYQQNKTINISLYGFSRVILLSIFFQLNGIKHKITKINEDKIRRLDVGQKVRVEGSIGIVEKIDEDRKVHVKFSDMKYIIPKASTWKINIYEGNRKITKYTYRPNENIQRERRVFANIFNFDSDEIPVINNYKTLIVCNRREMMEFNNITMKQIPLINLIPSGYYPNPINFDRMGKDTLQRNPLFCFTPNLEVATELIKNDNNIRNLIIFGKSKLLGNSIYLDEISNHNLENVSIIMDLIDIDYKIVSLLQKLDYRIIPENIRNIKHQGDAITNHVGSKKNLFLKKSMIINRSNLFDRNILFVESKVDVLIHLIRRKAITLKNEFINNLHIMNVVIKILGFLNFIRTMPLSIKELEEINSEYPYYKIIEELESDKLNVLSTTSEETFNTINEIIDEIRNIIIMHDVVHPKSKFIINLLTKMKDGDCIVVRKRYEIEYLNKWINQMFPNLKISIITVSQLLREKKFYNNIYFLGWYDSSVFLAETKFLGLCEHFIMYKDEWNSFNYYYQQFNRMISPFVTWKSNFSEDHIQDNNQEYEDLEFILNNMETALLNTYQVKGSSSNEEVTLVLFEEGQFAFLTNRYSCRVLDRDEGTIVKKSVSELKEGNEMVFVDTDEDVFNELIKKMRDSSVEINQLYKLSELWIKALQNYKNKYGFSEEIISTHLKNLGVSRHPITISNWLNDPSVIGTNEVIEVVSKLTKDSTLESKLTEVKNSCSQIRALHIRLGRYLANFIISSYGTDQNLNDKVLQNIVEDMQKDIYIVTVRKKNDRKAFVPYSQTNKLHDQY